MANVVVCKVRDLGIQTREWVARMFGRELAADEQVTVMVFPPDHAPSPVERQAAWERIKKVLDRARENTRDIPEAEMEAAIDEAMSHVRPR
jgi:hypothetical protein